MAWPLVLFPSKFSVNKVPGYWLKGWTALENRPSTMQIFSPSKFRIDRTTASEVQQLFNSNACFSAQNSKSQFPPFPKLTLACHILEQSRFPFIGSATIRRSTSAKNDIMQNSITPSPPYSMDALSSFFSHHNIPSLHFLSSMISIISTTIQ